MLLIPGLIRIARRFGWYDQPGDARKVHVVAIPRLGGIAIIISTVIPLAIWLKPIPRETMSILLGSGVLLVFGVWDDLKNLNYKWKLLGQILAILVVIGYGGIIISRIPLFGEETIPLWFAYPLTMVCLLGITNAVNLVDGLDGLAGGLALLSFVIIAALAFMGGDQGLVLVTVAAMGGVLGFLRFNTHPAQIFMGDAGSQFLGFMVGTLTVVLAEFKNTALSSAILLFIFGVPIIDTLAVVAQRIHEGRSPFSPDRNHIHHKLLALGMRHYQAVVAIYIAQAVFVIMAYFLRYQTDLLIVITYLGICTITLAFFWAAGRFGWKLRQPGRRFLANSSWVDRGIQFVHASPWVLGVPAWFVKLALMVLVVAALVHIQTIPIYFTVGAAVLLSLMLLNHALAIFRGRQIERLCWYFLGLLAVYWLQTLDPDHRFVDYANILFISMAVVTVLGVSFISRDRFTISPMDFLVVFIAIAIPMVSRVSGDLYTYGPYNLGDFAVKMLIIFYGIELVCASFADKYSLSKLLTILSLTTLLVLSTLKPLGLV